VRTYAEEVYTRIAIGQQPDDGPLGVLPSLLGLALLVMAGLLLCGCLASRDRPLSLRPGRVFAVGRWRVPLMLVAALMLAVLVGVPLGNLLCKAGVLVTQGEAGRLRSWSAAKCLAVIAAAPWRYQREFGWSLLIGGLSATAAVTVAVPLAWLARRGGVRSLAALLAAALGLAVPGPLVGLAIIWLLNRPECPALCHLYDRSVLAPCLAWTWRGLPAAVLILWHALRTIPQELLDSAAVDGAGPLVRLTAVVLPLRWPALVLAWLVALAVGLGDLAASILVTPPGAMPLAVRIFDLLHAGVEDQVAGICLALVLLFAALAACAAWSLHAWQRTAQRRGMV
jgi:iron(III) transport system permease protein